MKFSLHNYKIQFRSQLLSKFSFLILYTITEFNLDHNYYQNLVFSNTQFCSRKNLVSITIKNIQFRNTILQTIFVHIKFQFRSQSKIYNFKIQFYNLQFLISSNFKFLFQSFITTALFLFGGFSFIVPTSSNSAVTINFISTDRCKNGCIDQTNLKNRRKNQLNKFKKSAEINFAIGI